MKQIKFSLQMKDQFIIFILFVFLRWWKRRVENKYYRVKFIALKLVKEILSL